MGRLFISKVKIVTSLIYNIMEWFEYTNFTLPRSHFPEGISETLEEPLINLEKLQDSRKDEKILNIVKNRKDKGYITHNNVMIFFSVGTLEKMESFKK